MVKSICQFLLISPAVCAVMLVGSGTVMAAETVASPTKLKNDDTIAQVNPASQLSDVQPTDAEFRALRSLVQHYGCKGYTSATFPGNRAIKRDEFALILNACVNRVNELATTANSATVKKADLVNIKKLQQAFKVELAKWRHDAVTANIPSGKETQSSPVGVKQLTASTEKLALPVPGTVEMSADKLQATPTSDSPVSQVPATAPETPTPLKKPKYKFSYLGLGVNFGSGGRDSALGTTSFAAFSKFALTPSFSIRPTLLVNSENTTVLLPVTYDFPVEGPGHIAPYVGLGLQASSPLSGAAMRSDLLLTAGIDYPINSQLALTGGVNLGTSNYSGIGGVVGLAYIFNTAPGAESSTTVSPQSNATPTSQSTPTTPPSGDRPASDSSTTTDQAPKTPAPEEKKHQITENSNAHFQGTFIYQDKPGFNSPYSGANSLLGTAENLTYTVSATAYLGFRPWKGGEFYVNPELSSVIPVSNLLGLGGLSNGENQKGGGIEPSLYFARAFLRQTWSLGGKKQFVESGQNQLAGDVDSRRLVLTLGKIALTDLYGPNRFSGNPRTQFLNYSFLTYSALDYGANARGYTFGANLEYFLDDWAFRIGRVAVVTQSNGPALDWDLINHFSDQIEVEHSHIIAGQPGKVRLLGFHYQANMAAFSDALNLWRANGQIGVPSIADVRRQQDQFGFGLSLEQSLGNDVGAFVFGSWNGGNTENYSYMDVERALAMGLAIQGNSWGRPLDTLGFGYAINGIGKPFRQYLAAGGLGTFIGDGRLNYQPENILETYYNLSVGKATTLGFNLQYIINPGYNADRGPAFFAGARLHVEL